jgi:hypothetical protein
VILAFTCGTAARLVFAVRSIEGRAAGVQNAAKAPAAGEPQAVKRLSE